MGGHVRADLTAGLVGSLFALGCLALAVEVTVRPGSPYLLEQISLACSVLALSLAAVFPGRVPRADRFWVLGACLVTTFGLFWMPLDVVGTGVRDHLLQLMASSAGLVIFALPPARSWRRQAAQCPSQPEKYGRG